MRFMVLCRAIEPSPLSFPDQMELLEETQTRFAERSDPRVIEVYSFAGERAFAMVIEVASAQEVDRIVFGLPAEPLMSFEVHVVLEGGLSQRT